ncbi:MAG: HAMP domain-containing histidine kinase, partial [Chloroflexi bacterium]
MRLAAAALGSTLVLLAGTGVLSLAAAVLLLYLGAAVVLRYMRVAERAPWLDSATDLVAITALVYAFPLSLTPWVLYTFAIGVAELRLGPVGALAATALAAVGFDLALVARSSEARATDLWALQVLIAIGLVIAEVAWMVGRREPDRAGARSRALALLARTETVDGEQRALVEELSQIPDVRGAWLWSFEDDRRLRIIAAAGVAPEGDAPVSADMAVRLRGPLPLDRIVPQLRGLALPFTTDPPLVVGVAISGGSEDARAIATAAARDLVTAAEPLVAAAHSRARAASDVVELQRLTQALQAVGTERSQAGALAALVIEAGRLVDGAAGVVRMSDAAVLAGELDGPQIAILARDRRLPAIVSDDHGPMALVGLGDGRVLAATGTSERLDKRLAHLDRLARSARERIALLAERDDLQHAAQALGRDVESLGGALRAREDALATAVHELRNPLTAVHGYATLMSRNLGAVQGQLAQLERLMADLLSSERAAPTGGESVDAAAEVREAIARARVRSEAEIDLIAPDAPVWLAIDRARFAQLLDNLLSNAAKYSDKARPIVIEVTAGDSAGGVTVTDGGIGIRPEHLGRIFERFYRVPGSSDVSGQG